MMPITGAIERIRQNLDRLKPSEKRVALWILGNPSHCTNLNVRELADLSHTSQSAVIRFCQRLQFKSFPDLKLSIVADLSQTHQSFSEINPDSSFHIIRSALEESLVVSITNTLRGVREDTLERVCQYIAASRRIVAFGSGASAVVAMDIQQKLQRLGYNVWATPDFHTAAILLANFDPSDLLIAVSYSGGTKDVLEVAQWVRRHDGVIISITGYGLSPLSELSTLTLPISASEVPLRVGATASLLASLAIVNSVLLFLVNKYPERSVATLANTKEAVASHAKTSPTR